MIQQITNNESLRNLEQELVNFYQFLYHVTPVVIFQVKSWSDLTFQFCTLGTSFNPAKRKSSLLSGNNTTFSELSPIPRIRSAERIQGIDGNF